MEGIAEDVEQAVLDLDLDDLNARAGRKRWGYVEPTEAAWELLEEAVAPYLDEMRRRTELGLEAAAVAACQAIVLGLYRCQGQATDRVIGWAEDSPAEIAGGRRGARARERSEAPAHVATADRVQGAGAGVGGSRRPFRAETVMSNQIGKAGSRFFSEPPVHRANRECD